ncbi:MAG: long-chain fatty acid--CoA ligase [Tistrella sp.]|nr:MULTISPECIES: AMP-binding protein [Tistrella]MAD37169.1 long-chain fatty acid--CoA ligase [Tistrella sp.]MBA77825.1 long-chain fatty acid--CoA ligase [Tistrella sp.]
MTTDTPSSPILPEVTAAGGLTIDLLFARQARATPQAPALADAGGEVAFTYDALFARVSRLAAWLTGPAGLKPGDRFAVLAENRTEYVELLLAAAMSGTILAAINWRLAPPEVAHCLRLVEPGLIVASPRHEGLLRDADCGDLPHLLFGPDFEAIAMAGPVPDLPAVTGPESGLVILYTSGTTGLPKGALISHRAEISRAQVMAIDHAIPPGRGFVAWAPLFHMVSADQVLGTLIRGGKVTVVDGYDPEAIIRVVAREKIGWLVLMPGMIEDFLNHLAAAGPIEPDVMVMGCMADLVPLAQIQAVTRALNAPYLNSFGSTETGAAPASAAVIGVGELPAGLSKRQSSGCAVRLVDWDDTEVPDGVPGEATIRSPSLFSGYWNNPEATAEDFRGGWFHMGDMFVRNPDGSLDFVDRRKYLIKSGGENVYPAEIERLILAGADIREAVVVRAPDARWGEVPVAVVAAAPHVTREDVLGRLHGRLARYKLPKAVVFLDYDAFPRSTTGKIKRHDVETLLDSRGQLKGDPAP